MERWCRTEKNATRGRGRFDDILEPQNAGPVRNHPATGIGNRSVANPQWGGKTTGRIAEKGPSEQVLVQRRDPPAGSTATVWAPGFPRPDARLEAIVAEACGMGALC